MAHGASAVKHFSRFYVFLGCPLYHQRWKLWGAVIRLAAQFVPEGEVIRVSFDDTTKKKAGRHIEGLARYRNGAGSARQEYRTLRGVNFVLGVMHIPLTQWPGHSLSVPVGLELYLKPAQPPPSTCRISPEVSWSGLSSIASLPGARPAHPEPGGWWLCHEGLRPSVAPGDPHRRALPISAKLTCSRPNQRPSDARPAKKGDLIGSPKTLAQTATGMVTPPQRSGRRMTSLGWPVAPGVAWAPRAGRGAATAWRTRSQRPGQRKPPPAIEAFFTTDLTLSAAEIVREYGHRWAVEIAIRDSNAFDGLGQDQCRTRQRIIGANTFRLVLAAARTLCIAQVDRGMEVPLCRYRPWYRQEVAPSQLDVAEACREALHEAGIFPYHGSSLSWPKIKRSLTMFSLSPHRARN